MSRSVIVPTSRPPSVTGTTPVSSFFMTRAASTTDASASTVTGLEVMTSLTLFPMAASLSL
jgi:hypothetical protein